MSCPRSSCSARTGCEQEARSRAEPEPRWSAEYSGPPHGPGEGLLTVRAVGAVPYPVTLQCEELGISVVWACCQELGPITVTGVVPWSPDRPMLYAIHLGGGGLSQTLIVGFRRVHVRGREILLNGAPLFLRGLVHPEARPSAEDLVSLRVLGVNALLVPSSASRELLDAADRLGFVTVQEQLPESALHCAETFRDHPSRLGWSLVAGGAGEETSVSLAMAVGALRALTPSLLVIVSADRRGLLSDVCVLGELTPAFCEDLMDRTSSRRLPGCTEADSVWQRSRPFLFLAGVPVSSCSWAELFWGKGPHSGSGGFAGGFLSDLRAVASLEWLAAASPFRLAIEVTRVRQGFRPSITLESQTGTPMEDNPAVSWRWVSGSSEVASGWCSLSVFGPGARAVSALPVLHEGSAAEAAPGESLTFVADAMIWQESLGQAVVVAHAEWLMPVPLQRDGPAEDPAGAVHRPPRLSKDDPLRLGVVDFLASGAYRAAGVSFCGPWPVLPGPVTPVSGGDQSWCDLRRSRVVGRSWDENMFRQRAVYRQSGVAEEVLLREVWEAEGDDVVLRVRARPERIGPAPAALRFAVPEGADALRWWGTGPGRETLTPWAVMCSGEYASDAVEIGRRRVIRWVEFLAQGTVLLRVEAVPDEAGALPDVELSWSELRGCVCFTVIAPLTSPGTWTLRFTRPRSEIQRSSQGTLGSGKKQTPR